MRRRSDAGGEVVADAQDPKRVKVTCNHCNQQMTLAALQREGGKCFKCDREVDLTPVTPATTPVENASVSTTPTPGGNPWREPHPIEMGAPATTPAPVRGRRRAVADTSETDAAIATVRHDASPEPDPWELKPESVAVSAPTGVAPGFVAQEVPFTDLGLRLKRHGFTDSIVEIAKWTPAQREHALFVASALDKGLAPTVEDFLMKGYVKPKRTAVKADEPEPDKPKEPRETGRKAVPADLIDETSHVFAEPASVTAHWGEEKFTPVPYSTVTVGPFVMMATVSFGEDRVAVLAKLNMELAEFAATERDRKIASFLKAYKGLKSSTREGG